MNQTLTNGERQAANREGRTTPSGDGESSIASWTCGREACGSPDGRDADGNDTIARERFRRQRPGHQHLSVRNTDQATPGGPVRRFGGRIAHAAESKIKNKR